MTNYVLQLKLPMEVRQQIAQDILAGIDYFEAINKGADKLIANGMALIEAYAQAGEYASCISQRLR